MNNNHQKPFENYASSYKIYQEILWALGAPSHVYRIHHIKRRYLLIIRAIYLKCQLITKIIVYHSAENR